MIRSCENATNLITKWNERTGIQFAGFVNAVRTAACCAAFVSVPKHDKFLPHGICLDFRNETRISPYACDNLGTTSLNHFYSHRLRRACGTPFVRDSTVFEKVRHQIMRQKNIKCSVRDEAVFHVRSGDVFRSHPHRSYAQPFLTYYLDAWKHSNISNGVVISEDRNNPVVDHLRSHSASYAHNTWEYDLRYLLSAKTLIMSSSSLVNLVAFISPCLRDLYVPNAVELINCQYKTWLYRDTGWKVPWTSSIKQQFEIIMHNIAPHDYAHMFARQACDGRNSTNKKRNQIV